MRKLVVLRGHQGSGKSHAVRELGLAEWSLSSDVLRTVLASPVMNREGRMMPDQDLNSRVFPLLLELAEERMGRGETLVIDTTGLDFADMTHWRRRAEFHRYRVAYVDLSGISLETSLDWMRQRPELHRVPEHTIRRFRQTMRQNPIKPESPRETLIVGDEAGSHVRALAEWLDEPVIDLSGYDRVVHIGDLQGCHTVLRGPGGPLEAGFDPRAFYVFVGDLVDRGIENGALMRWFVDEAVGRDNVALMHGNHEDHLHRFARGLEPVSDEFRYRTLPQLERAGVTPRDADKVCDMAREFLRYRYRGREVFVNHAGLSALPEEPWRVSLRQYSKGTGYWSEDVDRWYSENEREVFQIHGHRNNGVPIRAAATSFNLEDGVEHGGNLRVCELSGEGWATRSFRNTVFRPLAARLAEEREPAEWRERERRAYPDWIIKGEPSAKVFDPGLLRRMREHEGVGERTNDAHPSILSLNFTRDVFRSGSWDDVVVKARGLFLDRETSVIAGRGYDKFFNVGERPEVELERLMGELKFPLTLYLKENGFLGNLGYDERERKLLVASKSTPDGPFAAMFRGILDQRLTQERQEQVMRYLRDTESSMTFEVIDPTNDPHIIEYDGPNIVLLDVVRRATDFRRASYDVLEAVGERFGLDVKERAMRLENRTQFLGWYKKAERDLSYRYKGRFIEGFVIEDAAGRMVKWKSPYYRFWKQMRSQHLRARKMLANGQMPKGAADSVRGRQWMTDEMFALALEFNRWMLDHPSGEIGDDLIEARNLFERHRAAEPMDAFAMTGRR